MLRALTPSSAEIGYLQRKNISTATPLLRNTKSCNFSLLPEFAEGGSDLLHPKMTKFVQSLLERVGGSIYLSDGLSAFSLVIFEPLQQFPVNLTEKQKSPKYLSSNMFCEGGRERERERQYKCPH